MKQNKIRPYLATVALLSLVACATTDGDKKLDEKLQSMDTQVQGDLSKHVQASINNNMSLTPSQKTSMNELRKRISDDLNAIHQRSLKLREILIKDFEIGDSRETSLIRERLQNLNNLQVALIFDTIKKANEIIGRDPSFRDSVNEIFSHQPDIYNP
jgi:hypothetical protein